VAIAAAALVPAAPALGSGDPIAGPTYVDERGGTPAERERFFAGRVGVVLVTGTDGMLFANWRLLHGLPVGSAAGARLARKCCDFQAYGVENKGAARWVEARKLVPGGAAPDEYIRVGRMSADYVYVPTCLSHAFDTAATTLTDRVRRYGADSPGVQAWLRTQNSVFEACGGDAGSLAPIPADAPEWLRKDHDYQQAAFALYSRRFDEAAKRFRAISQDPASPWRSYGLYLVARSLFNAAIDPPNPDRFAATRAAAEAVIAAPTEVFGKNAARSILRALDYREHPARLLLQLDRELTAGALPDDVDVALRDYVTLQPGGAPEPDLADWMRTMRSETLSPSSPFANDPWLIALGLDAIVDAVLTVPVETPAERARRRWSESGDAAWLIAALALTRTDDPHAAALAADATRVKPDNPAWLTAQYHRFRLTLDTENPADLRRGIDALLARRDLTRSDRNLFLGLRTQVAADRADLIRAALREPYCRDLVPRPCTSIYDPTGDITLGHGPGGLLGFGEDARAIIDRMPLTMRAAVARDRTLPPELRLDVALTSFARAVALRDDGIADQMASDLVLLLPQLRADWQRIVASRGSTKRYAQLFAMAKLPGLRPDLASYHRPRGTVRQFGGYWARWTTLPGGAATSDAGLPAASSYAADGISGRHDDALDMGQGEDDLVCRGKCGAGGRPVHLPPFVAEAQARATAERGRYQAEGRYLDNETETYPAGTVFLWDELLDHARANPTDPRSPEALYWLIRIGRWGGNYNHMSKRAFQLLHRRYPGSVWAKRSPYHYD
jgi:hypothetical protein